MGLNLTSVSVDSEVIQGFLQVETSAAALTPVIGMIKSIKNFQVGLFVGADYLSRDLAKNWVYQGKPWFGVGIGLGIFKISQSQKEKDQGD